MKPILRTFVALALSSTPAAFADGFGINVRVGTLGLGVEGVQRLSPSLDLRFGMNGLAYNTSFKYDHVDYDIEESLAVPAVYLDWRPMQGMFRLSAGAAYYNNVLNLEAQPAAATSYAIGNNVYTGAQIGTLIGKMSHHTGAPYLGAGWDFLHHRNFGISLDVGAFYRDRPDVTLVSTGGVVTAADLAAEAENIKGDESKLHPLLAVGFAFRF